MGERKNAGGTGGGVVGGLRSMNKLAAVGPVPGIAAMMKAPQHHDVVALDNEEQGVVKSTKDSLSHLTVDGGERFREPQTHKP